PAEKSTSYLTKQYVTPTPPLLQALLLRYRRELATAPGGTSENILIFEAQPMRVYAQRIRCLRVQLSDLSNKAFFFVCSGHVKQRRASVYLMRFIDTHPPGRRGTNDVRTCLGVGWVEAACCLATLRERTPHNMTYVVPPPLFCLAAGFEPTTIRLASQTQHHNSTMATKQQGLQWRWCWLLTRPIARRGG
ncbi:unnamed protein product, partial [Ilex paraguariensis]